MSHLVSPLPTPPLHALQLQDLVLAVHLGCGEDERATPQEVRISIEFRFHEAPKGLMSDEISDTICYGEVSTAVRHHCERGEFKLIERLASEIYQVASRFAKGRATVGVRLHKVHPPVEKLAGGSWYRCGDFYL